MTYQELDTLSAEIDQISEEMDWRDPNLESGWFDWAESRLSAIVSEIKDSMKLRVA